MDVRFAWYVPENGHTWKTHKGVQRLVWKGELKGGYAVRYVPDAGLFREFAAISTKPLKVEDAVLRFANKYGDITAVPGSSFYGQDDKGERHVRRPNAPLKTWRHQIEHMRWAVGLWDRCEDESAADALRLQAREAVQIEVEAALGDTTTPSCARACMNLRRELFVHPVNLLASMWLTLARLLSGEIEERPCAICAGHFYVGSGPGLRRSDGVTCSAACRQRKKRAG